MRQRRLARHVGRGLVISCWVSVAILVPRPGSAQLPPNPDADRALEMRIADGFTIAAVGDLIISRPVLQNVDPRFTDLVALLRRPDVTFGNFENTVLELDRFEGYPSALYGGLRLRTPPGAVRDLKEMGFDIVSTANNHSVDWGVEGLASTTDWLDAVGLVYAGTGGTMTAARAGRFLETSKGRVALVGMASSFGADAPAMDPLGEMKGRPGLSSLRTSCVRYIFVNEDEMERLREIPGAEPGDDPDDLSLLGVTYRLRAPEDRPSAGPGEEGRRTSESECEMNQADLDGILAGIRQAKMSSDFVLATIHAHGPGNWSDRPPEFLEELARAAIDAGADEFVGHGPHQLRGIEIYKGKPIFYSVGNFFFQVELQTPLAADIYQNFDVDPDAMTATAFLRSWVERAFGEPIWYQAVVAESRFERGQVAEIRLHPVELRYELTGAHRGTPHIAGPEVAREILESLQELSEPYGTEIRIEDGIGVIRVGRSGEFP